MNMAPEERVAIISTKHGDMVVEFYPDVAPMHVESFIALAKEEYFNGTTFHRVIPGFMIQGGDPTGTGAGGPGYQFEDEFVSSLKHDSEGILSMANAGPGTNGSQFFITHGPTPHLDGAHTVFGKVVTGMDVVMDIRERDPMSDPNPGDMINSIKIEEK